MLFPRIVLKQLFISVVVCFPENTAHRHCGYLAGMTFWYGHVHTAVYDPGLGEGQQVLFVACEL